MQHYYLREACARQKFEGRSLPRGLGSALATFGSFAKSASIILPQIGPEHCRRAEVKLFAAQMKPEKNPNALKAALISTRAQRCAPPKLRRRRL